MNATLLIELLTEELPPKALEKLGQSFADTISGELIRRQFADSGVKVNVFASPRRLAVQIPAVLDVQPEQEIVRKGPAVASGMKDGAPTPALQGFARSCGVSVDALATMHDGKQEVYVYRSRQSGEALSAVLSDIVALALKKLPVPKLMRWGDLDHQFVRPVHGLIMLHGNQIVPGEVLGLTSGNATLGHRFLSSGPVTVPDADSYPRVMAEQGKVIASFDARRALIKQQLDEAAARLNATIAADDSLFDEVCALVEWPVILEAGFEAEFLRVPQECLILTMQQNQKYFPLLDQQGKLINRFLLVSNLQSSDPSAIVHGNERVLRARLSDARFFFEQDQKQRLDSRVPRLADVVYHNKLGSQLERVERLQCIAGGIAAALGADVDAAKRAAYLAKADLVSDMVGEFPELQGIMGRYYASHDSESAAVADAIAQHYQPRFAGDELPQGDISVALALAEKLETLVGIWGIGLIPTGDKDPFALRRAALGVLRILQQQPLDLKALLASACAAFAPGALSPQTADETYAFCLERLKNYLSADYDNDVIDAVLALQPTRLDELHQQLAAVTQFKRMPEAAALAAANKRVQNILRKNGAVDGQVNAALLQEPAEHTLYNAMQALGPQINALTAAHDYRGALSGLAGLKTPVDGFFDDVMVMTDDAALRHNRLALLGQLSGLLNGVADIALLGE